MIFESLSKGDKRKRFSAFCNVTFTNKIRILDILRKFREQKLFTMSANIIANNAKRPYATQCILVSTLCFLSNFWRFTKKKTSINELNSQIKICIFRDIIDFPQYTPNYVCIHSIRQRADCDCAVYRKHRM